MRKPVEVHVAPPLPGKLIEGGTPTKSAAVGEKDRFGREVVEVDAEQGFVVVKDHNGEEEQFNLSGVSETGFA